MLDSQNSTIAPMKCKCTADIYNMKAMAARPAAPKETASLAPAPRYGLMLAVGAGATEDADEEADQVAQVDEAVEDALADELDHEPQVGAAELELDDQLPQVSVAFLVEEDDDHVPQVSVEEALVVEEVHEPQVSVDDLAVVVLEVVHEPQVLEADGVVLAVVVVVAHRVQSEEVVPGAAATMPTAEARAMIEAFILIDLVWMVKFGWNE